ncbi:Nop domain [Trinorchestia longiramus]|nr:Nop domain [Trinorchestia longiramus]
MVLHVLFEHAVGYSLYRVSEFEETGQMMPQVEAAIKDGGKFLKAVKLVAFRAFESAAESLENVNKVSEGKVSDILEAFLASNKFDVLGVGDPQLGQSIKDSFNCNVLHTGIVPEILRGIQLYLPKFIAGLSLCAMKQAELGLGHAYSRSKVKFNVNRVDNMIIQSIAINDQMDKDINTFAMRIREWYSYHFPELARIVESHNEYARVLELIEKKDSLMDDSKLPELTEIVQDEQKAQQIVNAARMSMGTDINDADMANILMFAKRLINLTSFRRNMTGYLSNTMHNVAPNLGSVVGDQVAARLISHAGSLTNLAKMPASTVQILGAEKALFRALKTKSNTPKYGLLYHSSFIGKAGSSDKGRISRFLANKCSIASRIDCFSENLSTKFGENLKQQVEDRLKFYETGDIPRKNLEVMADAQREHDSVTVKISKKKKRKRDDQVTTNGENGHDETLNGTMDEEEPTKKKKKKKKKEDANQTIACVEELKEPEQDDAVSVQFAQFISSHILGQEVVYSLAQALIFITEKEEKEEEAPRVALSCQIRRTTNVEHGNSGSYSLERETSKHVAKRIIKVGKSMVFYFMIDDICTMTSRLTFGDILKTIFSRIDF